ncbi:MAG: PilZ domain-containing protein [Myxococcaceae bacterium]
MNSAMSCAASGRGGSRDQRVYPRYSASVVVEVVGHAGRGKAVLQDVSLGGARLLASAPLGEWGDTAALSLPPMHGLDPTDVSGVIVRTEQKVDGWSVAVRFDQIAPTARERLQSLMDALRAEAC